LQPNPILPQLTLSPGKSPPTSLFRPRYVTQGQLPDNQSAHQPLSIPKIRLTPWLINWLTHANNATRNDAELGLSATSHVVNNYAAAALKREIAAPKRCSRYNSYRITID